jgi:hypothetical protein
VKVFIASLREQVEELLYGHAGSLYLGFQQACLYDARRQAYHVTILHLYDAVTALACSLYSTESYKDANCLCLSTVARHLRHSLTSVASILVANFRMVGTRRN